MFLPAPFGMALPIASLDPVDEALWYPVNPSGVSYIYGPSPGGINVGTRFVVNTRGDIHSLCYYRIDDTMAPSGKLALWQIDDTPGEEWILGGILLREVDFSGHSGTGWQVVPLPDPLAASPAVGYMVSAWFPEVAGNIGIASTASYFADRGRFSEPYGFLYGIVSNGQTDPRGFTRRNGFVDSGAFMFPTSIFSHNNYWVDAIINARPKPIPPDPPLTLKWPIPAGYPGPDNTGVDPDIPLTVMLEVVNSTADGEIIENLDCRANMAIKHHNVTVRNCKVRGVGYCIYVYADMTGARIHDCTIDGIGRQNINTAGIYFNSGASDIEVRRCNIYRIENGFAFGGGTSNVLIKDNFVHNLRAGPGSPHYDGSQMDGDNSNTTFDHNTIYNEHTDTSCLMIDNGQGGATDNVLITNNYMGGGGYTCYVDERFHMDGSEPLTNIRYIGNLMRSGLYGYYAISMVDPDNMPALEGNQYVDHGSVFDAPPPGGFVGGQSVPEDFFGVSFNIDASIIGEDRDGISLGMAFTTAHKGQIVGINFFRPNATSTTTVKVGLWRWLGSDRTQGTELLYSQTYEDDIRLTMVNYTFATPVDVNANDNLLVGVFIPRGSDGKIWYVAKFGFFWPDATPSQWGRMTAFSDNPAHIVNGFSSCNGLYALSSELIAPTNVTDNDLNHYVDPIFVALWPGTVTGAQTMAAASQTFLASLSLPFLAVTGAQTTSAATQSFVAGLNRFVTGAQVMSPATQVFDVAHAIRVVTGAQTLSKATQVFSVVHANRTVTGAQTTRAATQVLTVGFTPSGYPDATNTGHTRAPGYPGSLTPFTGTLISGTTYSFRDFPDDLDIDPGITSLTFIGCRFQSNARGDDSGAFTRPWNVRVMGGSATFSYCTFCPKVSIVAAPIGGVWPSAGTGTTACGNGEGGYASYCIGPNDGYQFALACYGTGTVIVDHCDMWGFGNAIDCNPDTLGAPITITNTWIHDPGNSDEQPNRASGYHTDGPGYLNGTTAPRNILIRNCTIAGLGNTNGIAFQGSTTAYRDITVDGCYLTGFGITVDMCFDRTDGVNLTFTNNIISSAVRWIHRPCRGQNTPQFGSGAPTCQWFNNRFEYWPGTTPSSDSSKLFTAADNGKFIYPNNTFSTTDYVDGHP